MKRFAIRAENLLSTLALAGVMILPLAEIAWRKFAGHGIPGSGPIALRLTMWVGLFGGAVAARDGKLLTLATGEFMPKGRLGDAAHILAGGMGALVATLFAIGGYILLQSDRTAGDIIAIGIPVWVADLALPVGFGLIALRLVWRAPIRHGSSEADVAAQAAAQAAHKPPPQARTPSGASRWIGRALAAVGILVAVWIQLNVDSFGTRAIWPWILAVVVGALFGGAIFALLGGLAVFLTLGHGNPPVELLVRTQEVLTKSEALAAIPLFTLAGLFLAEGRSSQRLLRLLRALFGWAPGGTAIAAATLCAFFTLFTGGSGVTILVLGGLLLPALLGDRYPERFSVGLLTASGSLGLLFPLALPLMLFAIVAQAPMEDLFVAGLLPGLLLLGLMALVGVRAGIRSKATRTPFHVDEALAALWGAKWELGLPVIVLGLFFSGVMTLTEAAPVAALYALLVQRLVHRDVPTWGGVGRVMYDCVVLVGGILLILGVASGLTDYFVDAQVTTSLVAWTKAHVTSQLVFLLCLNLFLLLVGTVMDIFSAIVVVVPLILPIAGEFGLNPIHLGIIFVANLELGFLHPPLGLNLLLASLRFKKPVLEVTWATLPMLGILAIGVLLITYWPWLTMGLLQMMHRV